MKIYYTWLVYINLLLTNFCALSEQAVTPPLIVYVQLGVFPGIEGPYPYNELCQQYQQRMHNGNYYWHQTSTHPYSARQPTQVATGLYLNVGLNNTQISYGHATHRNKRNEPWYTNHSRTIKPDLLQCSCGQLIVYFVTHNYSEEQILDQYLLYLNDDFVAIAKQIPGYEKKIRTLEHTWTKHKNGWNKFWGHHLLHSYIPGLTTRFQQLKREVDQEQAQKEAVARVRREQEAHKQKAAEELRMQTAAYCAALDTLSKSDNNTTTTAIPCDHMQARRTACADVKANSTLRTKKNYTIDAETVIVAHAYNIQEQDLTTMHGNTYEQQLHTEFLEQLDEVRNISAYCEMSSHNFLINAVGHSIAIGMEANRLQQPEIATTWANCGWQLLEIIEGIGEGLMQCMQNNVDIVLHPIHTLTHVVHSLKTVTGCCLRAIGTTMRWHEMMEHGDGLLMAQEMDAVVAQSVACGTLCVEKLATMPPRDIAKQVTTVAADIVLVPKMVSFGSTLCARAAPLVEKAVVAIRDRASSISSAIAHTLETTRAESPVAQTTEGMLMRMSEQLEKIGGSVSGSVGEVIKDSRLALEAMHAEYMRHLEAELEMLRLACDNRVKDVARFGDKYLKLDYEHILGINPITGRNGISKIGGFHHDNMHSFRKNGILEFVDLAKTETGFYKADIFVSGHYIDTKTLFPAHWSRKEVIEKIYVIYEDFIKCGMQPTLTKDGKYLIKHIAEKGVEIEMYITKNGRIVTAYPVLR